MTKFIQTQRRQEALPSIYCHLSIYLLVVCLFIRYHYSWIKMAIAKCVGLDMLAQKSKLNCHGQVISRRSPTVNGVKIAASFALSFVRQRGALIRLWGEVVAVVVERLHPGVLRQIETFAPQFLKQVAVQAVAVLNRCISLTSLLPSVLWSWPIATRTTLQRSQQIRKIRNGHAILNN